MATIAENLSLLQQTKNDIKTAIESKGQDLTSVPFTQYANKITNIGNETQVSNNIVYSDVDNGDEISITLSQLQQVKNDIKVAIENKGQDLTNVPFTEYANKILDIVIEEEPVGTEGLVYTGLNSSGSTTTDEAAIVAYMIGNNKTTMGNGYTGTDTEVVIPKTYNEKPVTQIGQWAFRNKTAITSVIIPSSVTTIGNYAFYGCSGLTTITLGNGITSLPTGVFGNSGLTSIEISANITSISSDAFSGCKNLASIIVSSENTTYKDDNGRAVLTADGLSLVAYAGGSGTSYIVPDKVTVIEGSVFSGLTNLKSIELPSSLITIKSNAFYNCTGLTSIEIPESVTSIESAVFSGCSGLTSIVIPNSVKRIGAQAFYNCSGLTSIKISNRLTTLGTFAFSGCSSVTSIELPNSLTSIPQRAFNLCSSLKEIIISSSIKTVESYAFYNCTSLKSIELPAGVTQIQSNAFLGCSGLVEITLNPTTPPTLSSTNAIPSTISKIYVPQASLSAYKSATNWSSFASKMVGYLPATEGLIYTGLNASGNIASSEEEIVAYMIGDGTSSDGNGYIGEETQVVIPRTYKGKSVTRIGTNAFANNTTITSITIPETITAIYGANPFVNCVNLASIIVDENNTSFSDGGNRALLTASGTRIVSYANKSGSSYTIPSAVKIIGEEAFLGCTNLTEIILTETTPPILSNTGAISTATTVIYVPAESVEIYKTATNWSNFATIIVGMAASWHTVWTGSLDLSYSSVFSAQYSTKTGAATGVKAGLPTRVSGTAKQVTSKTFSSVELNYSDGTNGTQVVTDGLSYDFPQYVIAPTTDNSISARVGRDSGGILTQAYGVIIQEIQQYY